MSHIKRSRAPRILRAHYELAAHGAHPYWCDWSYGVAPPPDAGLVHSALGGDVASFSALLDRYRASLFARALAYLGQPEDAADAVQETFLLALTRQD